MAIKPDLLNFIFLFLCVCLCILLNVYRERSLRRNVNFTKSLWVEGPTKEGRLSALRTFTTWPI